MSEVYLYDEHKNYFDLWENVFDVLDNTEARGRYIIAALKRYILYDKSEMEERRRIAGDCYLCDWRMTMVASYAYNADFTEIRDLACPCCPRCTWKNCLPDEYCLDGLYGNIISNIEEGNWDEVVKLAKEIAHLKPNKECYLISPSFSRTMQNHKKLWNRLAYIFEHERYKIPILVKKFAIGVYDYITNPRKKSYMDCFSCGYVDENKMNLGQHCDFCTTTYYLSNQHLFDVRLHHLCDYLDCNNKDCIKYMEDNKNEYDNK